jgi:hypothetical protein
VAIQSYNSTPGWRNSTAPAAAAMIKALLRVSQDIRAPSYKNSPDSSRVNNSRGKYPLLTLLKRAFAALKNEMYSTLHDETG